MQQKWIRNDIGNSILNHALKPDVFLLNVSRKRSKKLKTKCNVKCSNNVITFTGKQKQDGKQEGNPERPEEPQPAESRVESESPATTASPVEENTEAQAVVIKNEVEPCSPWVWTECDPVEGGTGDCGKGFKIGTRGGPGCKGMTLKQKPCYVPCAGARKGTRLLPWLHGIFATSCITEHIVTISAKFGILWQRHRHSDIYIGCTLLHLDCIWIVDELHEKKQNSVWASFLNVLLFAISSKMSIIAWKYCFVSSISNETWGALPFWRCCIYRVVKTPIFSIPVTQWPPYFIENWWASLDKPLFFHLICHPKPVIFEFQQQIDYFRWFCAQVSFLKLEIQYKLLLWDWKGSHRRPKITFSPNAP